MSDPITPASPTITIVQRPMSWRKITAFVLGMFFLAVAAFTAISSPRGQTVIQEYAPFLANPISQPEQWEVNCTAAETNLMLDTNGVTHTTSTLFIINSSATCVQIGGVGLTATTGAPIGTAATCYASATLSIDAKSAKCFSTGGTVTLDVLGGKQ